MRVDKTYKGYQQFEGVMSLPPDPPLSTSSYHLIFNDFCPNIGGNYKVLPETILTIKNPALEIMEKVIENKNLNNPKKLKSFSYNSYSKTIVDIKSNDSLDNTLFNDMNYLFLTEVLTKRKFLSPDLDNEEIVATKMSGLKHTDYYFLASQGQPFSFYEEPIILLNNSYLSPLNNSAFRNYDFKLEEKYYQKNDTIFIISFKPKPQRHFNSLKGILYISSNNYAIQSVSAEPNDTGKINLKIKHLYKKIDGSWFPGQLNYQATFTPKLNNRNDLYIIDNKTFIDSIKINPDLDRSDFYTESLYLNVQKNKNATSLISENRTEPLSIKEANTYHVIDSLGDAFNIQKTLKLIEKLPLGKISINSIDVNLGQIIQINRFEGARLGIGLSTNNKFDENFNIAGYYGYGIKDRLSKYGITLGYVLNQQNRLNISTSLSNTLIETGKYNDAFSVSEYFYDFNPRSLMSAQFDNNKSVKTTISARSFRYINWKLGINYASITPLYGIYNDSFSPYLFQYENNSINNYNTFQFKLNMRFAYKEKIMKLFDYDLSLGTKYPVLNIFYERGIKDLFKSDLSYNKIEIDIKQEITFNRIGTIVYCLTGGLIDKPVPYGLLFGGHGGFDRKIPFVANNHFQTMMPYEFVSDKFINLFLTYEIMRFFPNYNIFSPNISLAHNMGIGGLSKKEAHQNINFKTLENPYLESGLILSNLIKFDLYNVSSLGIGGGVFYRYGSHSYEKQQDNYVFKIDFAISLN